MVAEEAASCSCFRYAFTASDAPPVDELRDRLSCTQSSLSRVHCSPSLYGTIRWLEQDGDAKTPVDMLPSDSVRGPSAWYLRNCLQAQMVHMPGTAYIRQLSIYSAAGATYLRLQAPHLS